MKQTAVQYIEEYLRYKGIIINDKTIPQVLVGIINEAKEMEKQQIIDFANDLLEKNISWTASTITGEQYYNETFNK